MHKINVEAKVDDLPFDLLTQVERRLGVDRPAAMAVLGEWLTAYQPIARGTIRFLK